MREIKFRGISHKTGEFVYGSLVVTTDFVKHKPKQQTKTWIVTKSFGNGGWFNVQVRYSVKPDTVGQFTGQFDRNDIEIYEGDKDKAGNVVEYLNGGFCLNGDRPLCGFGFVVAGNIHEDEK